MSISNRVEQLIAKTSTSKTAFSNDTGISTVILSHISSGRNKVSLTTVEQILKAYPRVNAEWLILGKGQMLKDGLENDLINELEDKLAGVALEMDRHYKSAKSKISELQDAIANLKVK
jgi:DNA-binding Xre family transcriptional regulator